jgi:GNAT superfamily N-acetyltransferase
VSQPHPTEGSDAVGRRIDGESLSDGPEEQVGSAPAVGSDAVGRRIASESPSDGPAEQVAPAAPSDVVGRRTASDLLADGSPEQVGNLPITVAEESFGASDTVFLFDLMAAEIERRYADAAIGDGAHEPGPGARRAPRSLPPGDPGWPVTADDVTRPRGLFVVARLDGEPVGCAALRPLPAGPPDVGEVKRVFTTDAARRRGVARRLLDHLVSEAPGLGFTTLVLETGTAQPEAMAFYERAGWVPVVPYGEYASSSSTRCYLLDL